MEGVVCVINSSDDLTAIDSQILNNLSSGVAIYILKLSHMVCENSNSALYKKFINNKEHYRKVIFINEHMEHEFKIVENVYFEESRSTMYPCPADPMDKFKWVCPYCDKKFKNM